MLPGCLCSELDRLVTGLCVFASGLESEKGKVRSGNFSNVCHVYVLHQPGRARALRLASFLWVFDFNPPRRPEREYRNPPKRRGAIPLSVFQQHPDRPDSQSWLLESKHFPLPSFSCSLVLSIVFFAPPPPRPWHLLKSAPRRITPANPTSLPGTSASPRARRASRSVLSTLSPVRMSTP